MYYVCEAHNVYYVFMFGFTATNCTDAFFFFFRIALTHLHRLHKMKGAVLLAMLKWAETSQLLIYSKLIQQLFW